MEGFGGTGFVSEGSSVVTLHRSECRNRARKEQYRAKAIVSVHDAVMIIRCQHG